MWIALSLFAVAFAGTWADQEIDPKVLTDVSAYTVDKRDWRVGIYSIEYGLLTNLQVGTIQALYLLKVPNAHGKVTAIQTPKLDVSLQAGWFYKDLTSLGLKNMTATMTPIGWTGSWIPHRRWGIHFGTESTLARVDGRVNVKDIGVAVRELTGVKITKDLKKAVGQNGGLYGGANLNLMSTHFAVDFRLNRRDSIIFSSTTYLVVSGLLAAGVTVEYEDIEAEVGASARVRIPLTETLPRLNSLSWQGSWEHFHLRVGLPLPIANYFAYPQAINAYWVLGPKKNRMNAEELKQIEEGEETVDDPPEETPL